VIRVFFAEARKLRRPTLVLSTMLAVVGISGLFTALLYLLINSRSGNGREGRSITSNVLSLANGSVTGFTSTATLLGIVALCIFAAQTAQEYTFGTLRNLLVRQPSRMKILSGKYLSMALFALAMDLMAFLISVGISYGLSGKAHVSTAQWSTAAGIHAMAEAFGNVYLATLGFGTLGMILGLLLRSPISSVAIGSIWFLIVESLLSIVVKHLNMWLPGQLISAISVGGGAGITYRHALVFSALYLVGGATLVSILFKRRDVSN
jgi:ABC-2 type transport system permease protein